jgi:hypothetical protein
VGEGWRGRKREREWEKKGERERYSDLDRWGL